MVAEGAASFGTIVKVTAEMLLSLILVELVVERQGAVGYLSGFAINPNS